MKTLLPFALTSFAALALAGCSSTGLPPSSRLPLMQDAVAASSERFAQDGGAAGITRVQVPGSGGGVVSNRNPVPASLRSRPIRVEFMTQTATMGDLVDALSGSDVQIAFRWSRTEGQTVLAKSLPFTRFNGTLGGLLDALRTGMGIVAWQEGDLVFLSDADQYSVSVPQDQEILDAVAKSLTELGATDVVKSIDGGKIVYTAAPAIQDEVLRPFLDRTVRNLSTINLQVAIVSLALTDKSSQGFDWSKFSAMIDARPSEITATTISNTKESTVGGFFDLASGGVALGTTNLGTVFGVAAVTSVTTAIDFLSTFGNTNVTQNVDLRTLSGKSVTIRSGQSIPYVKGVNATASDGNVTGSAVTETVDTGLTVGMTPRFDSATGLVTVNVDLDLTSVLEFVDLSAGNQLGSLSQPRIQEQQLTDIVQMRAGQTVVIGGLQYDQESYNGNEPTLLRDHARQNSTAFGTRTMDVNRNSIFVILRPTVTIYESGMPEVLGAGVTK